MNLTNLLIASLGLLLAFVAVAGTAWAYGSFLVWFFGGVR